MAAVHVVIGHAKTLGTKQEADASLARRLRVFLIHFGLQRLTIKRWQLLF